MEDHTVYRHLFPILGECLLQDRLGNSHSYKGQFVWSDTVLNVLLTCIGNENINLAKIFNNLFYGLGNLCGLGDCVGKSEYK